MICIVTLNWLTILSIFDRTFSFYRSIPWFLINNYGIVNTRSCFDRNILASWQALVPYPLFWEIAFLLVWKYLQSCWNKALRTLILCQILGVMVFTIIVALRSPSTKSLTCIVSTRQVKFGAPILDVSLK